MVVLASIAAAGLLLPAVGAVSTQPATQPVTTAPSATRPAATAPSGSFDHAVIVSIRDAITDITHDSLKRRLEQAEEEDSRLIIIELDTPGGALGVTLEICNTIKKLRDEGTQVYAWVNDMAYSAGTIIALATDGIVMARNATIGDCQPIMITGAGASAVPEDIEAKATSPLLEELDDSARRNGYNYDMLLAFIRPEIEMFWVVNPETGAQRYVNVHGRNRLFGLTDRGEEPDEDEDEDGKKKKKKKLRPEPIPDSESKTAWKYVKESPGFGKIRQPIVTDRNLLTMRTDKAIAYGFCLAQVKDEAELKAYFNVTGTMDRLESNLVETAIEWLASPMVRGVLFLLMLMGAYTEFQSPGLGLPGAVSLVALILFLGAPYLAGYTVTWEIVAIMLGLALIAVELFVIPGFMVAGIFGFVLLAVGLLASFVPTEPWFPGKQWYTPPSFEGTYTYARHGLYSLAGGLTGGLVGMVLVARYFPRLPIGNRIIIPNPTPEQVHIDDAYGGMARVGDIGQAESLLRPAGKARFGARMVDVVSEGEYVKSGTRVKVVERHGNRVVVRPVD